MTKINGAVPRTNNAPEKSIKNVFKLIFKLNKKRYLLGISRIQKRKLQKGIIRKKFEKKRTYSLKKKEKKKNITYSAPGSSSSSSSSGNGPTVSRSQVSSHVGSRCRRRVGSRADIGGQ
jgi:hypothetical protein